MEEYHKIPTIYKRDPDTKFKTLLEGEFVTDELDYLRNNEWDFTEKVDGTNIRVSFNDGQIRYGGRTDNAQIPTHLSHALQDMFGPKLPRLQEQFPDGGICFYGEGYGPKIQKGGGNYRDTPSFVLFDIRIGDWWLKYHDVKMIAHELGITTVPLILCGKLERMVEIAREGFNSAWGDFPAEGLVARPSVELVARNGKRIITKIKCKDFHKEEK